MAAFNIINRVLRSVITRGATSLEIPSSVTSIGSWAFASPSLVSLRIPSSVTSIGDSAFSGCSSLVNLEIPSSVTFIGDGAFYGCSSLVSLGIPSSVTSIGPRAFSGCSSLVSLKMPSSVPSIGRQAFYGCSSLVSLRIPASVTSIGEGAFCGCRSLASLRIPSSVTSIGKNAFYDCSSLVGLEIPDSVTSIGENAFYGCSSLVSLKMPSSVTSIGRYAFSGCTNIRRVVIDKSTANARDANGLTLLDRMLPDATTPGNVIKAMIAAGALVTEAGLARISDAARSALVRSWARGYAREVLYKQAFEFFYAHQFEQQESGATANISRLPIEVWARILCLDAVSHPDFPWLTKKDLLDIRRQLEVGSNPRVVRMDRAVRQSVLYGYNDTLHRLRQLGQQQADDARWHDWKKAGGSTALVLRL